MEAIRIAKAVKPVPPQQKVAEAAARVGLLEGALAAKTIPTRSLRPVGECLDLSSARHPREETSRASRGASARGQGSPGAEGGEIGQWVAIWKPCEQRRQNIHAIAQNPAPCGKPWTSTPTRS